LRPRTRTRVAAVAAFGLVVGAALVLGLRRANVRPTAVPPEAPQGALDVEDLRASRGVPLRVEPPTRPPMTIEPPTLRVLPAAPPLPAPSAVVDAPSPPPQPTAVEPSAPLEVATGSDAGASAEAPVDPFLRLRTYVHPEIPSRVVAKRKIDDTVTLQVKVGTDGRVQDVRILRAIPNCDECNQNAVAAAWRFAYEAPVGGAVWAAPIEMQFRHGRGR